ncbi:hypothetical protein ACROYT_G000190 [Oculina patagonica]
MNIEQDEYFGELTEEAGIRIDISDQGEMPFPLEKGMSPAPGYATMIGLKRILIKRADPGGTYRCSKETSTDKYNVYTKMFNTTYSLTVQNQPRVVKTPPLTNTLTRPLRTTAHRP